MEDPILSALLVTIGVLGLAALASLGLKKLRIPFTIGLLVIGLAAGWLTWNLDALAALRGLELSPEIIMHLVLPCLIFDAAIGIDARLLGRNLAPILLLAAPGLVLSALAVGYGLTWLTPLSLGGALLFGALVSATDPVAVIALFKEIGAPKRLVTLVDGESVFNDATAIVLFGIVLAAAGTGARPDLINGAGQFVPVLAGGVLIGGLVGLGVSFAFLLDRRGLVFQKTLSLLAAYASFLLADRVFHLSGVMSTLAAGLVIRWRAETAVHPSHIENIEHAWSFFAFVANSFVFILLGLTEVHLLLYKGNILSHLPAVLISIPLVLAARALCVWGVLPAWNLAARRRGIETVPASWQAVIFWGGLRGAVPVALVLAIPADFPNRETIVHATMANILFTLLVQGTTVKWLMERLGIRPEPTKAG